MALDLVKLPKDVAALTALLLSENAARVATEARSTDFHGQVAHLKLTIAKLQRSEHGASSEKGARLLNQLELQLGELVETSTAGKVAVELERPASKHEEPAQKPARRALDAKLPRERQAHATPCA